MEAVLAMNPRTGFVVSQQTPMVVEGVSVHTNGVEFLNPFANGGDYHERTQSAVAAAGESVKGKHLRKKFGRKYYTGTVAEYEPDTNWYKVIYEDGDSEELEWAELEPLLVSDEPASKKRRGAAPSPKSKKSRKTKPLELVSDEPLKQIDLNQALQDATQTLTTVVETTQVERPPEGDIILETTKYTIIEEAGGEKDNASAGDAEKPGTPQKESGKKRGRKPKAKTAQAHKDAEAKKAVTKEAETKSESTSKTPRKRGRPKASGTPRKSSRLMQTSVSDGVGTGTEKPKKGRVGRPAKESRKVGRPKKAASAASVSPQKVTTPSAAAKGKGVQKIQAATPAEAEDHGSKIPPQDRGVKLLGRKLTKDFDGRTYNGEIASYNRRTRYYKIHYEDGDEEELEWKELEPLLLPVAGEQPSSSSADEAAAGTSKRSVVRKSSVKVVTTTVRKRKVVQQQPNRPMTRSNQKLRPRRKASTVS